MSDRDPIITVIWMMTYRLRKPKLPKATCWKVAEPDFCMILGPMFGTTECCFLRHILLLKKTYIIYTQQNFFRLR